MLFEFDNTNGLTPLEYYDYADFNEQLGIYILRGGYYDAVKGFSRESRWETLTF